jgi:ABC-2 type transport system permease protein
MNHLVHTELIKQRTSRTFVAGTMAVPAVAALITLAILSAAGKQGNDPLGPETLTQVIGGPTGVITVIAVLLGMLGMAGEYRHHTITTTFLATPRRSDVLIAKLIAHSLTGALIGLLSLSTSIAIAVPWLATSGVDVDLDGDGLRVAFGLLASTALFGALGVSIGALVRNQTTAAAMVLVWLLAIEGLIGDLVHDADFVNWLPAAAGRAIVDASSGGDGLPRAVAVAVFTLYVAAFAAASAWLTLRRDIT